MKDYDVAVIGAGVLGCAVAHRVASTSFGRQVALFDRGLVAHGCSNFAGALATPAVRSKDARSFSDYSREWYALYRANRTDSVFRDVPIIYVLSRQTEAALTERVGHPLCGSSNLKLPDWLWLKDCDLVLCAGCALWADVSALCAQWIRGNDGIDLYECTPVSTYEKRSREWVLWTSDGRSVRARHLVIAKGSWLESYEQCSMRPIRNKKVLSYTIDAPATDTDSVIYFFDSEEFLLPLPDRHEWRLSIVSEQWDCAATGEGLFPTSADLRVAEFALKRHAPALLPLLRGARTHCDTYTSDYIPLVATKEDGRVVVAGGSGSGFRYAPAIALEASKMLEKLDRDCAMPKASLIQTSSGISDV